MEGIEALSTIERLKILKSISIGCTSQSDFEEYLEKYSGELSTDEARRRVDGLLLEDEFLLLCKIMRCCDSISGLEQGLSIQNHYKTPDYLASFNLHNSIYDSKRKLKKLNAFVEVKTTNNIETKKIGAGFLKKYSAYAENFGVPLLIASRLKLNEQQQWWILQTQAQFESYGRKASVGSLSNCISHIAFNDYFITATQDVYVDLSFSSSPNESNIIDPLNGYLNCVHVRTENLSIKLDKKTLAFNLFLDCFAQEKVSTEKKGNAVTETRVIRFMQGQLLSDMLLRANFSVLDSSGLKYSSASRLLALVESGKASILYREYFEKSLDFFNTNEMLFMITKVGDDVSNNKIISSVINEG
ncbi:hypothetical protein [Colwellia sp. MB02u-14]|jgi:hypothetical protein|uniref:hypothetical protein n=1 Tax=Colwellia sp. MB02u-14 TaxID=2759815 RepID=UPI0015F585C6|nr:hypothetical protein [Colwellia sp. MB02u-14]MBA6302171.1 hypothetical protein [Colwellia sp. MB02u-14]